VTAPAKPASRKQLHYLIGLVDERQLADLQIPETLTMEAARELIGYALTQPKPVPPTLAPGFYRDGEEVYRVRWNKDRTGTYAARLAVSGAAYRTATWEYAPGWAAKLGPDDLLTVAEAARLGHHHGVCVVCRKRFTDPFATKAGLDAHCRAKLKED